MKQNQPTDISESEFLDNVSFAGSKSTVTPRIKLKFRGKQNRSVKPDYSNIYRSFTINQSGNLLLLIFNRRKLIEDFTPAPRNNGHAKAFVFKNLNI